MPTHASWSAGETRGLSRSTTRTHMQGAAFVRSTKCSPCAVVLQIYGIIGSHVRLLCQQLVWAKLMRRPCIAKEYIINWLSATCVVERLYWARVRQAILLDRYDFPDIRKGLPSL